MAFGKRAMTVWAAAGCGVMTAAALAGGGTAEYTVFFEATWSEETHPQDFPVGAHFSPLIGGTHGDQVAFWEEGELASVGIERMAETGSKTMLRAEVQAAIDAGTAGAVIEGFVSIGSPGMTSTAFIASADFPLATVVTMIAPSPDWFVGVSGVPLRQDGAWVRELVVELYPYDAGTDSGVTYQSPNQDTQPPDPIMEITGYPFLNEKEMVAPLGTFTFVRTDCPADLDGDGDVDFDDLLAVLAAWGDEGGPEDLDDDGDVDFDDLLIVLAAWGPCAG